jgi:putative hydrolase of the HAD superfamily
MNIVFDFAGVVFEWQPPLLLRQTLPRHAVDDASAQALVAALFQGFTRDSDWAAFDLGYVDADTLAARIAQRTGLAQAEVRAVVDVIPLHLLPVPGTVALLRRLKEAGHRLFYLSNMPAPYADHLDRSHDFIALFEAGVYSARVNLMKPQPEIFELAARRFGVEPTELLFIDDVERNVAAARSLGWRGLHFKGAASCAAALPAGTFA